MSVKKLYLFVLLLPAVYNHVQAQSPVVREIRLIFNGKLLQSNAVMLAGDGLLWLGGTQGVFIYNGFNLKQVYTANRQAKEITCFFEDSSGVVWAGTKGGGILKFIGHASVFVDIKGKAPRTPVTAIISDVAGNLWVASAGEGVFAVSENTWIHCDAGSGLTGNIVSALARGADDNMLCGTNKGICMAAIKHKGILVRKVINRQDGLPSDNISALLYSDHLMMIGFHDAPAVCLNPNKGLIQQLTEPGVVVSNICRLKEEVWLGTEGKGIYECDAEGSEKARSMNLFDAGDHYSVQALINTPYHYQLMLINHKLYVTQGDWLEKISIPAEIINSEPRAIAVGTDGIAAAYNTGLFFRALNPAAQWREIKLPPGLPGSAVTSMLFDYRGMLWMGSSESGIYCYDRNFKIVKHLSLGNELIDNNITRIILSGNNICYGSRNGIGFINPLNGKSVQRYPLLSNWDKLNSIFDIAITPDSALWVATDGNGILKLTANAKQSYLDALSKEKKIVYCISGSKNGDIWYSSLHHGVYLMKAGQKSAKNAFEKSEFSTVHVLVTDAGGRVVTVHDDFLGIFDPVSAQQYTVTTDFNYGASRGNNNLAALYNGNYYFTSNKGIYVYHPSRFAFMSNLKTFISGVNVNLQPLSDFNSSPISLAHNENHVNFELVTPWPVNQEKVRYQYIVEGLNRDTVLTTDHYVNLPNLLPGKYVLKVRPMIEGSRLNTGWTEMSFVIHKPWYRTWWFMLCLVLLFSSILFVVNRLYLQYKIRENAIERQRLQQEIRILNNQINPHFLFNSLNNLISIIDIDTDNAKIFTENLADFYRLIVTHKDDYVITLAEDIKIAGIYIALQNTRFADAIHYKVNVPEKYQKCFLPPLTLQILLENAIKHNKVTRHQPLLITIDVEDDFLKVTNRINPKENMEISTGSGIRFIFDRFNVITGTAPFILKNEAEFTVKVPLVFEEPFPV